VSALSSTRTQIYQIATDRRTDTWIFQKQSTNSRGK